jgi:hypothetical protein
MFDSNVGDEVTSGQTIARIFTGPRSPHKDEINERFMAAVKIGDDPPVTGPLVLERIAGARD